MRDIKFRAWDKACKCWIQDPWRLYLNGGVSFDGVWVASNEVTLEQFTGLKDKNGVDIYEGDVVRCLMLYATTGFISSVEWGMSGFTVREPCYSDFSGYAILDMTHHKFEVIGNIHEGYVIHDVRVVSERFPVMEIRAADPDNVSIFHPEDTP